MKRSNELRDLQILAILVPALCAGVYEYVRHSVFPSDLPYGLGTLLAAALVLAISFAFAHISFGIIRRTQARLRERNTELQALSREVERLAVVDERDRLAREIHDGVAQVLASLLMRLDVVESLAQRGRVETLADEIRELRAVGAEAYADVREAIADLRTQPEPGPLGLGRALAEYVTQFGDRAGVEARFESSASLDLATPLAPVAEMQLLRIVQEALANVRRHAAARHVVVRFWHEREAWHVSVTDDGLGFDPRQPPATEHGRHLGMQIMRERAESVAGGCAIQSEPGAGTTVHAWVPAAAARGDRTRARQIEQGTRHAAPATAAR